MISHMVNWLLFWELAYNPVPLPKVFCVMLKSHLLQVFPNCYNWTPKSQGLTFRSAEQAYSWKCLVWQETQQCYQPEKSGSNDSDLANKVDADLKVSHLNKTQCGDKILEPGTEPLTSKKVSWDPFPLECIRG